MSNDAKLNQFLDLFEKWNKRINLSAASTRRELEEHLDDSRHVLPVLADLLPSTDQPLRVLDVGSGGGFPVVIAAIYLPTTEFVSVEAIHKKHAFLRTATRELGLLNLDCRAERLEDHDTHDYDAAMSRATFDLATWLERGADYVRLGGRIVGFEGQTRPEIEQVERVPYVLNGKSRAIVWHIKR